ncbi:hypothetical protein GCM10011628_13200 [Lactobacillus acetotolerans DSM 20749 = JCM 3825]|nr:hypothetical protein GCM10011628_13200 [Lactobacillus acetotolerans DSM 20749 = JCM 3825]
MDYRKNIDTYNNKKDPLENRLQRDKIKSNWCKKNNIPLIVIPYKYKKSSFNKIKKIVNQYLDKYMVI